MATTLLRFQSLLLVLIVSMIYCYGSGSSQEMGQKNWKILGCQDKAELYGFNQDVMKEIMACPATCRSFCHIKILNLINDKGLPDESIYEQWVDETYPEKYKSLSKKFFGDCFQKFGNKIDLSDKECKVADQFADCTWGIVAHLKCG